jgi:hypothetical protein
MISNFFPYFTRERVTGYIEDLIVLTKTQNNANVPYKIFPSTRSTEDKIVIFSDHLIYAIRLALSEPAEGVAVQMTKLELDLYYLFLDYQDGIVPEDDILAAILRALNEYFMDILLCRNKKNEDYIAACFDVHPTWVDCQSQVIIQTP